MDPLSGRLQRVSVCWMCTHCRLDISTVVLVYLQFPVASRVTSRRSFSVEWWSYGVRSFRRVLERKVRYIFKKVEKTQYFGYVCVLKHVHYCTYAVVCVMCLHKYIQTNFINTCTCIYKLWARGAGLLSTTGLGQWWVWSPLEKYKMFKEMNENVVGNYGVR